MVAVARLHRSADFAGPELERDVLEFRDHLSASERRELPPVLLAGRVVGVLARELREVLAFHETGHQPFDLRLRRRVGLRAGVRVHRDQDVGNGDELRNGERRLLRLVLRADLGVGHRHSRPDLQPVDEEVVRAALLGSAVTLAVLVVVRLEVGLRRLDSALEAARRNEDVLDRGLVVLSRELPADVRLRDGDARFHEGLVLPDEKVLAKALLERLRLDPGELETLVVFVGADELSVLLEEGERGDLPRELLVGHGELQAPGGLDPQLPVDHAVQDLAGQVECPRELGREAALVHLAVALDLVLVHPVELGSGDLIRSHPGHDLIRRVAGQVRAREEDESENEDDDDHEERPLQMVEARAHGLEHGKGSFLRTGDYSSSPEAPDSRQSRRLCYKNAG